MTSRLYLGGNHPILLNMNLMPFWLTKLIQIFKLDKNGLSWGVNPTQPF